MASAISPSHSHLQAESAIARLRWEDVDELEMMSSDEKCYKVWNIANKSWIVSFPEERGSDFLQLLCSVSGLSALTHFRFFPEQLELRELDELCRCLSSVVTLKRLTMLGSWKHSGHCTGDVGKRIAQVLIQTTSLHYLHFESWILDSIAMKHIASALITNTTLRFLHFYFVKISEEGMEHIARMLQSNTCLSSLIMIAAGIDSAGSRHLASGMNQNSSLQILDLIENPLGAEGIAALTTVLKSNTCLQELLLGDRKQGIGSEGASAIAELLRSSRTLKKLVIVNDGSMSASDIVEIARAIGKESCVQHVDVSGCDGVAGESVGVALLDAAMECESM